MQDDKLPKVLVQIFNKIFEKIHLIECQERAEQAGAVQPLAFVDLPAAGEAGRLRFCTNCRKVGEGLGAGTGTVVYDDTFSWKRTGDDTLAAI